MLGRDQVYWGLALVTIGALGWAGGCAGGTSTTGTGGTGGTTTSTTTTTTTASSSSSAASSSSSGVVCPPGEETTFVLTKVDWGEGSNGQWKSVGFNIDGLTSTAASTDVCQPNAGGSASVAYPDGDNGIDNSFGANLLPTLLEIDPNWVTDITTTINDGNFNALLKVSCLPPTGDASGLSTKLFGGTPLGMMPKFDGTDVWPVAPELLSDPKDPESSSIIFPDCSVTGSTFDIGKNNTIILTVPINAMGVSTSIKLTLYAAQLTMTLAADRKSATGGMVGGVLNTADFVAEVKKVGYALNLCNSQLLNGLIALVEQSSDILADGTQDPTKTCDGISLGFTFEMGVAQIGIVGPPQVVGPSCM